MTRSQFSPIRMTAATQAAAVAQALQIVGASPDEVSVEVLSTDTKGVTVRVSPRRDDETNAPTSSAAPVEATPVEVAPIEATETETDIDSEIEAGDSAEMALQVEDEASEDEAVAETETPTDAAPVAEAPIAQVETTPRAAVEAKLADDATQERVRALAQDFLDRMGLTASATISDAPLNLGSTRREKREGDSREERDVPRAFLQVDGEDVGILIGKHGQTLQSFQYLLNVTLNNQMSKELGRELGNGDGVRVLVDAGGYRAKRGDSLQEMAREAAERAKRDNRSIRMEPMPAHERRLVHLALENDGQISTSSEGREPLRHVIVIPAGAPRLAQSRDNGGRSEGGRNEGGRGFGNRGGNRGGSGGGFGRGNR